MSSASSFDPEALQKVLADAFAVQESALDAPSLAAVLELQDAATHSDLSADDFMQLVADRARAVAGAAGVAIALMAKGQLVYRAGSGSAAPCVGRQVIATLAVPTRKEAHGEILRVEDVETDMRIEAAICRQREAKAQLMLAVYQGRAVAGVLEVLFGEAHRFQDREVRIYRLMAQLVGEVTSRIAEPDRKKDPVPPFLVKSEAKPVWLGPVRVPNAHVPGLVSRDSVIVHGVAPEQAGTLVSPEPALARAAVLSTQPVRVTWLARRWKTVAASVAVVALALGVAHRNRRPAAPLGTSEPPASAGMEQQLPFEPQSRAGTGMGLKPQIPASVDPSKAATTQPLQARSGESAPEDLARDVTIRYVNQKSNSVPLATGLAYVDHIGDDVTVRHFEPRPILRHSPAPRTRRLSEDVTVRDFAPVPATAKPSATTTAPSALTQ